MSITKVLYLKAPWPIKNVLVSLYGLRNHLMRHGRIYKAYVPILTENLALRRHQHEQIQLDRLKAVVLEAKTFSPFYQKRFADVPEEYIRNATSVPQILHKLPLLEKADLRGNTRDIANGNPRRKTVGFTYTSGTTGSPMKIGVDAESVQLTFAIWKRYYNWMGLPERFHSVRFSGRVIVEPGRKKPPFWVYNAPQQQLFMSTYHMTEENLPRYVDKLNRFKPVFLDGYPSAFYVLSTHILKKKKGLRFRPLAISTTAETLFDYQREAIEEAFMCKVYNQYASSEGSPWIAECSSGNYHLWTDTGCFEFMNMNMENDNISVAELVVTSFQALKTPLIRYRIGDYVTLESQPRTCPCGSAFPLVNTIIGRQDDILYTDEKGYVGRLDPAYKGLEGIKLSKVIQHEIDNVEVLVVPDSNYDSLCGERLIGSLGERLGQNVRITLTLVKDIPLGRSGKFKAVERRFAVRDLA